MIPPANTPRPLVVGFGVTGRAVARHLGVGGPPPVVIDDRPDADTATAAHRLGIDVEGAPDRARLAALVAGASMIVVSPGVPATHPVFALAAAAGVAVRSEIELAWTILAARARPRPRLVAVTGTNGKTSVVSAVAAVLAASGLRVGTGGNIGNPLVEVAGADVDVIVAEVSSAQLSCTDAWHPDVSCWLNFSPDHLDWHPSVDAYQAAKARIWANQGPGDTVVINADDPVVVRHAAGVAPGVRVVTFSTRGPADYHLSGGMVVESPATSVTAVAALPRRLPHDLGNALAVTAVARAGGASIEGCARGLAASTPLPHRVQWVAEAGGIAWYDDSKATTPASVLAAVAGFASVILIAGGRNKGLDLSALRAAVPPVRSAVAIGEASGEIEEALGEVIPVAVATTMDEAVARARVTARPGDVVILSPGCASFDWYRNYGDRGDDFAAAVRRQTDGAGGPERQDQPC